MIGIIVYNANHEPVLSLSICFECDKISIWSKEKYHFSDDYEQFNYDKAEKQMSDLLKIMMAEDIPAYTSVTHEPKYLEYVKSNMSLNSQNSVTLNAKEQLVNVPKIIDHEIAKAWAHPSQNLKFKESIVILESFDDFEARGPIDSKLGGYDDVLDTIELEFDEDRQEEEEEEEDNGECFVACKSCGCKKQVAAGEYPMGADNESNPDSWWQGSRMGMMCESCM